MGAQDNTEGTARSLRFAVERVSRIRKKPSKIIIDKQRVICWQN